MILKINDRFKNREIRYFDKVNVVLKYDAVASVFQLDYYFNPDNVEHRELSCIGHYHGCELWENNELVLKGTILSIEFPDGPEKQMVSISGYSLPGVLEDCEVPPKDINGNELPGGYLQSDGLRLREIVEKICKLFKIQVIIDALAQGDMESVYSQSDAKQTQNIKSYFAELVSQKNVIMTHNAQGNLIFTKAIKTKPIFHFERGEVAQVKMKLTFNGQAVHSIIWVFAQQDISDEAQGEEQSAVNPFIPNRSVVFRPRVATMSSKSDDDLDTKKGAENLRASELRSLTLQIELDRMELNGKIIRPGSIISVTNKYIYLYNKTDWFIESVTLHEEAKKKTSILNCVPPEAFTGGTPVYPFSGINLHPVE